MVMVMLMVMVMVMVKVINIFIYFYCKQDHQRVMVDPMLLIGLDCPDRFRLP